MRLPRLSGFQALHFRLRASGRIQNERERFISGDVQDERPKRGRAEA